MIIAFSGIDFNALIQVLLEKTVTSTRTCTFLFSCNRDLNIEQYLMMQHSKRDTDMIVNTSYNGSTDIYTCVDEEVRNAICGFER